MKNPKPILLKSSVLLLALFAACSGGGGGGHSGIPVPKPKVVSNTPVAHAIDVPLNAGVSATFSEAMDPTTLNTTTFTLTSGTPAVAVPGTVIYANTTATLWPSTHLTGSTLYTATVNKGALNLAGIPITARHSWKFTTGTTVEAGRAVDLGTAGNFAVLAKAGISTVPTSAITGDLGISPAAASFITGFALTLDASNKFSTSSQVTGNVYAADYAPPTPANLTTSVLDMQTAYADAAARAPDNTELGAGDIGGMTLVPGVYKWGTGLLIPTDVTLTGSATDVWVFQVSQNLTMSSATNVVLAGGALPENVFWQVAGLVDVGTTAHLNGVVLCATAINLQTGASVNGRLLAQTAVTVDNSTVVEP